MDKKVKINYTNINKFNSEEKINREVIDMSVAVPKDAKIVRTPRNAKELRKIISRKPAFGMKLVDQHKQGR